MSKPMEVTDYVQDRAKNHDVTHQISSKNHYFETVSKTQRTIHGVILSTKCDCRHMAVQGQANGTICSHILAVFEHFAVNRAKKKISELRKTEQRLNGFLRKETIGTHEKISIKRELLRVDGQIQGIKEFFKIKED